MAIRKIAQMGEPILRRQALPVRREQLETPPMERLIEDMIETMRDADGAGLAAPQIFESLRIVIVEVKENPRYPQVGFTELAVLINPRVTPLTRQEGPSQEPSDCIQVYEGCLSISGLRGRVTRPRQVFVEAWDPKGNDLTLTWDGFRAAVIQHEADHLDGVLFVDRAERSTLTFLREFERYVPANERVVDHGVKTNLRSVDL